MSVALSQFSSKINSLSVNEGCQPSFHLQLISKVRLDDKTGNGGFCVHTESLFITPVYCCGCKVKVLRLLCFQLPFSPNFSLLFKVKEDVDGLHAFIYAQVINFSFVYLCVLTHLI